MPRFFKRPPATTTRELSVEEKLEKYREKKAEYESANDVLDKDFGLDRVSNTLFPFLMMQYLPLMMVKNFNLIRIHQLENKIAGLQAELRASSSPSL